MVTDIYEDSLYGQVVPVDWDDETLPGIMLLVDGEEEFIIETNEDTESLAEYIDRWVTAEGVITETDEVLRLKVRNYTLEDEMDFDNDEDW